jgi:hypothetical protein
MRTDSTAPELTSAYMTVRPDSKPFGRLLDSQHQRQLGEVLRHCAAGEEGVQLIARHDHFLSLLVVVQVGWVWVPSSWLRVLGT